MTEIRDALTIKLVNLSLYIVYHLIQQKDPWVEAAK